MSDKPVVHDSLADLGKEMQIEPYALGTAKGVITFPNPADMDWLEAEAFLGDILQAKNSVALKKWLSEADYTKLAESKPTLGQITVMARRVTKHYEGIFGAQGEAGASRG